MEETNFLSSRHDINSSSVVNLRNSRLTNWDPPVKRTPGCACVAFCVNYMCKKFVISFCQTWSFRCNICTYDMIVV